MKVSFIVVWSSTKNPKNLVVEAYPVDTILDDLLLSDTKHLLRQIQSIPVDKEILLMDNSGDFPTDFNLPDLRVIESIQSLSYENDTFRLPWYDKIPALREDSRRLIAHRNHTAFASLAFQHGLEESTGDYVIMQHNDTEYLFNYYSKDCIIHDTIKHLEDNNLEYITIDAKPPKSSSPKHVKYFADCYWFLCRRNFYDKHQIYIDWEIGDTNYLATVTCTDKNLKFLHLPGFYEGSYSRSLNNNHEWRKNLSIKYPGLLYNTQNVHTFNDIPFIQHVKGGTGLSGTRKKRYRI